MHHLELTSTVDADVPPEAAWATLLDAAAWPRWCGPVRAVHVVPTRWEPGEALSFTLAMGPGVPVRFDVVLTEVVEGRSVTWSSTKWWGVRGTRTFSVEPTSGGARLRDTKVFESPLWPLERLYPTGAVRRMSERWLADLASAAREPPQVGGPQPER